VVITGWRAGRTTRGFLDGWDPESGKKLWRRYTRARTRRARIRNWPKDMPDAWKYGGGSTGRTVVRPELDLVYWGNGQRRAVQPGLSRGADSL